MLMDVTRFSALLIISVVSFAFAFAFIARDHFVRETNTDGWDHFRSIPFALQYVALGVFDPIEVLQPEEKLNWDIDSGGLSILRSSLFLAIFFAYLVFMILLMTNLIIAVMTASYQQIDNRKSRTELLKMQASIQYQQVSWCSLRYIYLIQLFVVAVASDPTSFEFVEAPCVHISRSCMDVA